jgi:hypothetical protein
VAVREWDDEESTRGHEKREEDEGHELTEADRSEEAEDKKHEAEECGEAPALPCTVRGRLERDARACDNAIPPHANRVTQQLDSFPISSTSVSPPTDTVLSRPAQAVGHGAVGQVGL